MRDAVHMLFDVMTKSKADSSHSFGCCVYKSCMIPSTEVAHHHVLIEYSVQRDMLGCDEATYRKDDASGSAGTCSSDIELENSSTTLVTSSPNLWTGIIPTGPTENKQRFLFYFSFFETI